MAISNFIPQVWSARLQENLHKALVFGKLCNRHYEGDIAQYGDTVHIGTVKDVTVRPYTPGEDIVDPERLDGEDMTLTIDHGAYYNFYLNDVDAAQARADLMDAAMRSAAGRLAEDTEAYVLEVIREGAGTKAEGALPQGGVYELLVDIKTRLDSAHMPKQGRCAVMPPALESQLLLDNRFITGTMGEGRLAEGAVARAAGFDIYISPDLNNEVVVMNSDAVTFASQLVKTEAYRREKGFDDGVKGLSLCGAKVLRPECVYVHTITG
ncbi:MAG: P22 phage major capsid protein family protein [Clostridia bacterium]|nr:P22 phage major capsid protein family protein [Clostridia bacterium]